MLPLWWIWLPEVAAHFLVFWICTAVCMAGPQRCVSEQVGLSIFPPLFPSLCMDCNVWWFYTPAAHSCPFCPTSPPAAAGAGAALALSCPTSAWGRAQARLLPSERYSQRQKGGKAHPFPTSPWGFLCLCLQDNSIPKSCMFVWSGLFLSP